MRNREILSSLVGLGLGTLFMVASLREGLFRKGVPGPGFLPFITALILMGLSLMVFFPALGKKKGEGETVEKFFPEKDSFKKISLGLGALFLYGVSLEYLGYIATTILFLIFTFRLIEKEKWKVPLFFAVSTAFLTYLLFVVLLEVQLPKGILGIG
jgi:putative tricarboxylic transport membrane protein